MSVEQLERQVRARQRYWSKGTRRPCKYPFHVVAKARELRDRGFFYTTIAERLTEEFRDELNVIGVTKIPWITVRDWTQHYYRMRY